MFFHAVVTRAFECVVPVTPQHTLEFLLSPDPLSGVVVQKCADLLNLVLVEAKVDGFDISFD
jgi:hypothetical protein